MIARGQNRPWELPNQRWVMHMRWSNLAFFHWPVAPEMIARLLPTNLPVDTYEGQAWLAITPLWMSDVRPRWAPPLPWVSAFPELNVRTYVSRDDKPGVWFFSLDTTNALAVHGARWMYSLPYFSAEMLMKREADEFFFSSARTRGEGSPCEFTASYKPVGNIYRAEPGSLDYWLIERYCLYSADARGRVYRTEINHAPWHLQRAQGNIEDNTMADAAGVALSKTLPLVHYSERLDTVAWLPEQLDRVKNSPRSAAPQTVLLQ